MNCQLSRMRIIQIFFFLLCRVIVGAPEAQTAQPNVYRGGAVYRCDIAVDDNCVQVEFDNKGEKCFAKHKLFQSVLLACAH